MQPFEVNPTPHIQPPPSENHDCDKVKARTLILPYEANVVRRITDYESHATLNEKPGGGYSCSVCTKNSYRTLNSINKHLRVVHYPREQCTICNETFYLHHRLIGRSGALAHVLSVHKEDERVALVLNTSLEGNGIISRYPFFLNKSVCVLRREGVEEDDGGRHIWLRHRTERAIKRVLYPSPRYPAPLQKRYFLRPGPLALHNQFKTIILDY